MGMNVGGRQGGPMADINVTPLVDVVLVLLIIFMIVTPMLASPLEVTLPDATKSDEAKDLGSRVVIFMAKPKNAEEPVLYVGRERSDKDSLVMDINEAFKTKEKRELLIRADANLTWRDVHEVLTSIHDGGVKNMFLATRKAGEDPE